MEMVLKRRMKCCAQNSEWRKKNTKLPKIMCDHCQCLFYYTSERDEHMRVHECRHCREIAVDDDERIHRIRHRQEAQLEELQEQRQRKMDDDFVLGFVKANRLNEYRSQLDYEPDFDYIVRNYRFEREEWLSIVKKFKRQFLKCFFNSNGFYVLLDSQLHSQLNEQLNAQLFSYLLENQALSVHDAMDFLNMLMNYIAYDDHVSVLVSHLVANGCKIEAEWVARAISDDGLIERIKTKQTFTFDEVHKARKWHLYSPFDVNRLKTFYTQMQKHFFNPDFENPLDEIHDGDIKCAQTTPNHTRQEYWRSYNGKSNGTLEKGLNDLIKDYVKEMRDYDEVRAKLNRLIDERNTQMDEYDYDVQVYYGKLNGQGQAVSRVYFAIAMK